MQPVGWHPVVTAAVAGCDPDARPVKLTVGIFEPGSGRIVVITAKRVAAFRLSGLETRVKHTAVFQCPVNTADNAGKGGAGHMQQAGIGPDAVIGRAGD